MNKHQHHSCNCEHSKLAYCHKCKVPHCLDCGMEWVTKPASYWYQPYYNGYGTGSGIQTLPQVYCGSQTISNLPDGQPSTTSVLNIQAQTSCDHAN